MHLIGQSLGGVLARELARDEPARVAQVIRLGTPGRPLGQLLYSTYKLD